MTGSRLPSLIKSCMWFSCAAPSRGSRRAECSDLAICIRGQPMPRKKTGVLFRAFDRNPSSPGLTSWFMHLHGLVPVALRGKIPEFLPGWKAIFAVLQSPTASGAGRRARRVDRDRLGGFGRGCGARRLGQPRAGSGHPVVLFQGQYIQLVFLFSEDSILNLSFERP